MTAAYAFYGVAALWALALTVVVALDHHTITGLRDQPTISPTKINKITKTLAVLTDDDGNNRLDTTDAWIRRHEDALAALAGDLDHLYDRHDVHHEAIGSLYAWAHAGGQPPTAPAEPPPPVPPTAEIGALTATPQPEQPAPQPAPRAAPAGPRHRVADAHTGSLSATEVRDRLERGERP